MLLQINIQEQCDIPEDELDMCHLHTYDTPVTQIR